MESPPFGSNALWGMVKVAEGNIFDPACFFAGPGSLETISGDPVGRNVEARLAILDLSTG